MATDDRKPKKGIGDGLILALFFLLSFVALGYSVEFSVFLAIVGGLSGGFIIAWWNTPEDEPEPQQTLRQTKIEKGIRKKRFGITEAQRRRQEKESLTPKGLVRLTDFLQRGRRED